MMFQVVAKLAGEAMLSLYPMIVKLIDIPMHTQMWTRFVTYAAISSVFMDWEFIAKSVLSPNGWWLMVVTLVHVYTSYEGFAYLESGVSYSIFYLYPILILLMAGEAVSPWMGLALIGVWMLYRSKKEKQKEEGWWGYAMIFGAAITEAWIYFLVRNLPTLNNWNHVFLSYVLGAVGLTVYEYTQIGNILFRPSGSVGLALGLNAGIGLFGYLLRFYAASRLSPQMYAPLSYFGVLMAYVYGLGFGTDTFSWTKVAGTACILSSNYALLK